MSLESAFAAVEAAAPPASVAGAAQPPAPPTGTVEEEPKALPGEVQSDAAELAAEETPSTTEPEVEPDLDEVPESSGDFEKFKDVLKAHPEVASQLKHIIGREKAFSEMAPNGSFGQMREILELIPTKEDAQQLVSDSENRRLFGQQYREDPATFVESLKTSDPFAFQKLATELPNILSELDPELYTAQSRFYNNGFLNKLVEIAHQEGNQDLLNAAYFIANHRTVNARLGQQQQQPQRSNPELERLRKEKEERDQADNQAAVTAFNTSVDDAVGEDMLTQIDKTIKEKFLSATPKQLAAMVRETYERSMDLLRLQPQTMAKVNQFREDAGRGKRGEQEKRSAIQFITGRTRLIVPQALKVTFNEWSQSIIAVNKQNLEKKTALAAKTKDVGNGPGATTSAAAPARAGQGKRHANDIFASIEAGTYAPKR